MVRAVILKLWHPLKRLLSWAIPMVRGLVSLEWASRPESFEGTLSSEGPSGKVFWGRDLLVLPLLKTRVGLLHLKHLPPVLNVIWNHQMKLSVRDSPDEMAGINHLQIFWHILVILPSCRELAPWYEFLSVQSSAVGTVVSSRWVALTFKIVKAVWTQYSPLPKHSPKASREEASLQPELTETSSERMWRHISRKKKRKSCGRQGNMNILYFKKVLMYIFCCLTKTWN